MTADDTPATPPGEMDDAALQRWVERLVPAPHAVYWAKSRDLRYIHVTPAWERLAGIRHEAVIGRRDRDFRPAEVAERFAVVDRRVMATGVPETHEERLETAWGWRAITTTKFPIRDAAGRVVAVGGLSTEAADRLTLPAPLRTDEALLAVVLEGMPEQVVRFTPDLRVTFANSSFLAAYAPSGRDPVGADLAGLLGPGLVAEIRAAVARIGPDAPEAVVEHDWLRDDGRPRWRQWRLAAAFAPTGGIAEIQAIGADVTDQVLYRRALERLLSASRQPDQPLEATSAEVLSVGLDYFGLDFGALVVAGRDGRPVVERLVARAGVEPPAAGTVPDMLATLPLFREDAIAERDARASGVGDGRIGSLVSRRIGLAGEAAAVVFFAPSGHVRPFPQEGPMLMRLIAQWLDVAVERHRRLAEVSGSRAELSLILETVPAQILTVGPSGTVLTANAAARLARRPPESVADDLEALAGGTPRMNRLEQRDDGEGGTRWMRTDRVPFVDPPSGETRLLVVTHDVTEAVEKERALAKANEGLNQFAYIASHDLQEPLRKIGTFVDILMEGLAGGNAEDVAYASRVIRGSARRASALIKDLLAWSRLGNRALDRRPLQLAALVREIVADVLAARPGEPVEIIDEMADLVVPADEVQARQLVENLVVNAVKYRHPDRPARIVLRLQRSGRRAGIFEVADNGIGFDPAHAAQIFEPFRRLHADRDYSGTGVGLAICAKVCEQHGWTIDAIGRPGEGATFRVRLGLGAEPARGT